MKKCPFCAEEIQDAAIVCKHCGRDISVPATKPAEQAVPNKKNKTIGCIAGVFFALVIVCVGIVVIVALSSSDAKTTEKIGEIETTTKNTLPISTNVPAPTEIKLKVYKIGDIIKIGTLTMVVNGISFPEPDNNFMPKEGNKFISVDVTFENKGKESDSLFAMMQMTLKDDTGQNYTEDMNADISAGTKAPNGEIAAGEKIRGQIGYQVPNDAKGFQFVFDASIFSEGKIFVDLGQ